MRRRAVFAFALWPFSLFRPKLKLADISFRMLKRGEDRRRYIWIHGNETSARQVLTGHMKRYDGKAYVIENDERNVNFSGGKLDPNRMFSRVGAERNLRLLNPAWSQAQLEFALAKLDNHREGFLSRLLPPGGKLLVALHNNGPSYSVNDEIADSDSAALNDESHPDEFLLCTDSQDFQSLARGPYNVLLQNRAPKYDDGSLSRLCAARGVRYVNIEAAAGGNARQQAILEWLEKTLS
ncbi:MAG: hypothetical protein WKF37_01305 [Bryobacteraceae bacterium]